MPKQKTATRKTKGKADGGKKKKGELLIVVATEYSSNLGRADPMAPKRGLSAYMFFANEQRENVREENPGIAFGSLCPQPLNHVNPLTSFKAKLAKCSGSVGRL